MSTGSGRYKRLPWSCTYFPKYAEVVNVVAHVAELALYRFSYAIRVECVLQANTRRDKGFAKDWRKRWNCFFRVPCNETLQAGLISPRRERVRNDVCSLQHVCEALTQSLCETNHWYGTLGQVAGDDDDDNDEDESIKMMLKKKIQKLMVQYGGGGGRGVGGGGGGDSYGSSDSDGFEAEKRKKRKRNAPPPLLPSSSEVSQGDSSGDGGKRGVGISGELLFFEVDSVSDGGRTINRGHASKYRHRGWRVSGRPDRVAFNAHFLGWFVKGGGHVLLGSEAPAAVPPIEIGLPPFPHSSGDLRSVSVICIFPIVAALLGQVVRTRNRGRRRPEVKARRRGAGQPPNEGTRNTK